MGTLHLGNMKLYCANGANCNSFVEGDKTGLSQTVDWWFSFAP